MNRNIRLLSVFIVGFSALAIAPTAHAEDFSLHLEPGLIQPLNNPQDNLYGPGMVMGAKGMFVLKPWLEIGPSVSAAYLPKMNDDGSNAGVLWQFGGSARIQRSHSIFNDNGSWSPWMDIDLMAGHTGDLWRPTFDVGVGVDAALDHNHSVWIGPFVRYTQVLQTSDVQDGEFLDHRSPSLIQAGVSVSFDFPTHTKTRFVHKHDVEVHTVHVVEREQVATTKELAQPETFEITQHVYFDRDKSTLRWEAKDKLDEVISKLNTHHNVAIHVQGHASSDGQKAHNEKLAAARAESVRQYMVSHGIDNSRLTVDNFGIDRPAADNKTQEGRERSRRVEFELTFTSVSK
jgi:outer membrane protein OmpA-like peptidoglycan-associated protein